MSFLQTNSYRASKPCRFAVLPLFIFVLLAFLWPASFSYCQQSNETVPQEYTLEAIYLYNFLQFVHWPEGKCKPEGEVREIAVIGDSPIGESLVALKDELKRTKSTEITIRFYGPYVEGMDLSGCRLLFISKSEMKNIGRIMASIKDEAVLTVSDAEDCINQGCMIALLSRMNKMRWAVNRKPAERAGLQLNSRLLAMAVNIIE